MKAMTFFELGFLDLLKAIFFGKKFRLVLSHGMVTLTASRGQTTISAPIEDGTVGWQDGCSDSNWHPGNLYNPYSGNPFDTPGHNH